MKQMGFWLMTNWLDQNEVNRLGEGKKRNAKKGKRRKREKEMGEKET